MCDTDNSQNEDSLLSINVASDANLTEYKSSWAPQKNCRSWKVEGDFFVCYLLISSHPKGKNYAYIGSTNDPNRRIRQHNGELSSGAYQTLRKRPWEIALLVHGFPTHLSALQFEWAWQKPHLSRHISREFPGTYTNKVSEQRLPTKLRALAQLLQTKAFSRWPLNLHFLKPDVQKQFYDISLPKTNSSIPVHMSVTSGTIDVVFPPITPESSVGFITSSLKTCYICEKSDDQMLDCPNGSCQGLFHMICLANALNSVGSHVIPTHGSCPKCGDPLVWGKLAQRAASKKISLILPE